jgi:hypothetical protein
VPPKGKRRRRMLKIPWTARKSNKELLKAAEEKWRIITLVMLEF